jgi:hypothetical protein
VEKRIINLMACATAADAPMTVMVATLGADCEFGMFCSVQRKLHIDREIILSLLCEVAYLS